MRNRKISKILSLIFIILFASTSYSQTEPDWSESVGDGTLRRIYVPILMYHYVSPLPENADDTRTNLTLDPTIFRQHIQYLDSEGYSSISLYEMNNALERGVELPSKPIILTFDDGYIDHYTYVYPVLREFGFTGTFFIATAFIDENRAGYMNWQQVKDMADSGMNMEAHTKNHVDLRNRDYDFLVYEIMGSFESLKAHTGIDSEMFAYPVGHYDENTLAVLDSTPAIRAVTTEVGAYHTTDNYLEMPRMRITNETGVSGLAYLLNYGK